MDTKKLRQKILDLAIRGKLVPQDPNDEPASLLLERIRAEKERLIKEGKIKRSKKTAEDESEAPFEIPESWEWTTIDEICFLIFAGGDKPEVLSTSPTEKCCFPVFANAVQNDGLYGYTNIPAVTNKAITISARGTIGFVCKRMSPFTPIVRLITVIPPESLIDYLTYTLCCLTKPTEGSSIPQLTVPTFKKNIIPLPPLAEQERIVDEIERWFTLIDELESNEDDLLKAIDKAKSKILDLAIHGKLVPQDPNDEPAIELLKRINPKFEPCDNELDDTQLPDNWCWTTLGNIFNHNTGKALNKSDSQEGTLLPYITTSNVYWNRFDFSEIKKMYFKDSEIDKCTITKGDLLVCEGGDIGRSAIWTYGYDICIQNHIHRLRAKGDVSHLLYLYVLMFYKWTDRIRGNGIGLQGLSSGLLDKMIVPLPPYQEQLRIVSKIEELFAVLDDIKESLA